METWLTSAANDTNALSMQLCQRHTCSSVCFLAAFFDVVAVSCDMVWSAEEDWNGKIKGGRVRNRRDLVRRRNARAGYDEKSPRLSFAFCFKIDSKKLYMR